MPANMSSFGYGKLARFIGNSEAKGNMERACNIFV